jgi:hypothetical protein
LCLENPSPSSKKSLREPEEFGNTAGFFSEMADPTILVVSAFSVFIPIRRYPDIDGLASTPKATFEKKHEPQD